MADLVTIVTPTFNRRELVAGSIRSVLAQTYSSIEYIVVDDGSTDGTTDLIRQTFPGLTLIRQANAGQVAALRRGWSSGKGNYLAYLSDDDLLAPDAIARLVAYLGTHLTAAAVYPDCDLIDEHGGVIFDHIGRPFSLRAAAIGTEVNIGPGAIFRRADHDEIGGWDSSMRLGPDRDFWMRLASRGEIAFLPEVLSHYRYHPRALSVSRTEVAHAEEYVRVAEKFFAGRFCPPELRNERERAIANAYLKAARIYLGGGSPAGAIRSTVAAWGYDKSAVTLASLSAVAAGAIPFRLKSFINRFRKEARTVNSLSQ